MKLSHKDWLAAGADRYGTEVKDWKFRCPACGHVASVKDWQDAGANEGAIAFSCVGRWSGAKREAFSNGRPVGPCNYAGGGLFRLNPIKITSPELGERDVFDFADRPLKED